MVNNSQGGYRIIDLQEENIFEKMAEIITEPKPLLIAGNTENGTTDFITASHEIQINRDGNGNVISYRVPTGAVNHSDIDGRGEKDWWQYFTYVTPSGNTFTREKVSEVFNREAQIIDLSFPSELVTSVIATSNIIRIYIKIGEYFEKLGTFDLIGNTVDVDSYITYRNHDNQKFYKTRFYGTISYNEDTLMYDISLRWEDVPFGIVAGKIDVSLLSDLVKERRKSDKLTYGHAVTYDLTSAYGNLRLPESIELTIVDGSDKLGLSSFSYFTRTILTLGTHNYEAIFVWDDTVNKYQLVVTRCTDAEPLYADTELYGDVKINDHNIDVADGVISVKSANTENRGVVQIDDTNITITDESIIGVPTATKEVRGVVQVGDNIDVTDGVVSVPVATSSTKGVVSVSPTIHNSNGQISVSINSLLKNFQYYETLANVIMDSISYGNVDSVDNNLLLCSASLDSTSETFTGLHQVWSPTIKDEDTFIGFQTSQKPSPEQSAYFSESVLLPYVKRFLIHKVTISENTYYVRVPIYFKIITVIKDNPSDTQHPFYFVNGYIDFKHDSEGKWDSTNFIPDLEVGATGTKVMTYDTSTSQVTPMMKAFSVNITMPDGNTYSFPSHELYVQDGKAYIVTADINLNQENPAVTDTFATYTFTRVF